MDSCSLNRGADLAGMNSTKTLALLPVESYFIQPLLALICNCVTLPALNTNPSPKLVPTFGMLHRNIAVAFAFFERL